MYLTTLCTPIYVWILTPKTQFGYHASIFSVSNVNSVSNRTSSTLPYVWSLILKLRGKAMFFIKV